MLKSFVNIAAAMLLFAGAAPVVAQIQTVDPSRPDSWQSTPPATTATPLFLSGPTNGSVVILTARRAFAGLSLVSLKPKSAWASV